MQQWFLDNIIAEIFFGILLLPLIWFVLRWLYDYFWRAPRIVRILSIHNDPTRTWRKGIYARDRFMEIYENGGALASDGTFLYGGGDGGGAWHREYLDKGILSKYGLVIIFEEEGRKKVKVNPDRLTKMGYTRIKNREDKEEERRKNFVSGKDKLRDVTR